MMDTVDKYPNALTHAGSKGVHSPEIYSYLHAKMLKFRENYDPKSNFNMPITDVAQKANFKNEIEGFLKEVGRAFLQEDNVKSDPPSVNNEIRKMVTELNKDANPDKKPFSFFCQ